MALSCTECGFELKPAFLDSAEFRPCHICHTELSVAVFPAAFSVRKALTVDDFRRTDEESSCFHHASKRAVAACSRCGKFLCALCKVDSAGETLCPECLVFGQVHASDPRFERERTLYDSIALALAVLPAFTVSLTILGAPAAIFVALRYWRRPTSVVRRFAWRRYAALIIGIAQIAFWIFILVAAVITGNGRR